MATLGLVLVIFALARSGRSRAAPAAVGAYIGAAYFFTSSTSFANPAITVGRMFSATFAGIAPASVPGFVGGPDHRRRPGRRGHPVSSTRPSPRPSAAGDRRSPGKAGVMVPRVLFVCVHNAGRSQMAAALLDHEAQGRVQVSSAGSQPAAELNPAVVAAMAEIGLDLSRELPRPLAGDQVQAADVVVTMGCGDACPFYPGKRYLDWDLPDPAGLDLAAVRPIRDDIRRRVRQLLSELDTPA